MLQLLNAREREASEWVTLFQEADERYQLINILHPEGSSLTLLEFEWRGGDKKANLQD